MGGCVTKHWSTYPVGESRTGYVDPSNPRDLRVELGVKSAPLVASIIFAIIATIAWAVAIAITCFFGEEPVSAKAFDESHTYDAKAQSAPAAYPAYPPANNNGGAYPAPLGATYNN